MKVEKIPTEVITKIELNANELILLKIVAGIEDQCIYGFSNQDITHFTIELIEKLEAK